MIRIDGWPMVSDCEGRAGCGTLIVVPACTEFEITLGFAAFNASTLTPQARAIASSETPVPAVTRVGHAAYDCPA